MSFAKYASKYVPKINDAIKIIYDRKLSSVNNTFLTQYYSELKDYFLSGGKRIRPLLCIATFNGFIKDKEDSIITPSVGTEFLHNASLIHDDIIDKDLYRRGKPAFHYRYRKIHENYKIKKMENEDFGNSIGIIGGDSAFFIGLEAYLQSEFSSELNLKAIELYEQAFVEVSNGVLIETDMVNKPEISISEYIEMISLKTGALIEKSILVGAVYAELSQEFKQHLSTYGKNLGIVFQITDDILGTYGDEKVTGKPTDGDIREGKKTCLLINALSDLEDQDKVRLLDLIQNPNISREQVEEVKQLFSKANATEKSKNLAQKYYDEAMDSLNFLKPYINENEYDVFVSLIKFVMKRNF